MKTALIVLAACSTPSRTSTAPTTPTPTREVSAPAKLSKEFVRSLAIGSRVPLVEREHGLMAGYVDDATKPGVVHFVIIADNGENFANSTFRLDDENDRSVHEAAVARFLAPGRWSPMRPGTVVAPTKPGAIMEWKLDDRLTAHVNEWGTLSFSRDNEAFAMTPWVETVPTLHKCTLRDQNSRPGVTIKSVAYDSETRLVWVVFDPVSEIARRCGLDANVHGFEVRSPAEYPAEFLIRQADQ